MLASSVDAGTADTGIVTDTFVGSKVAINKDTQNTSSVDVKKTEIRSSGDVLGASTTRLPGTGSSTLWTYAMWLLVGFGGTMTLMGLSIKWGLLKKIAICISVVVIAFIVLSTPNTVRAEGVNNLTIRISEPKTPINQLFDLVFVTLDIQDRPMTVKCFKKGPGDAGYSQFGSDINLISGGNSSQCDVNSPLVSQNGTYNFYTTVTAGADSATSQIVAVDYNTSGPGTPTNYSKDRISSCQYKISFKTSDDAGKTVKVEVYRSESTSFGIDPSNRVGTVGIGSNTDGNMTDTVPNCDRTYYYVIRAYDAYGNGSGTIGDSVVTMITTSSTTSTTSESTSSTGSGAIPVIGSNIPAEGGSVLGEETIVTPSNDATKSGSLTPTKTVDESTSPTPGEVLGAVTSSSMRPWYIAAIALAVGIIIYVIYRKRNQNKDAA